MSAPVNTFRTMLMPTGISLAVLGIHFFNNAFTTYGIFRDELYYIACSNHLAFGYVDQPPLCAFLLWISRNIFGESIFALRLLPSFLHAITVFLSSLLTRKIGGGVYAQSLSAISVALAPGLLGMFGIYSMNAIEILLWICIAYLLIRLFETENPAYWYWIGLFIGIGLLNKISMSWLAAGLLTGFLLTDQRRWLRTPYPWISGAIALLLFSPFVIWNIQNDFAHVEFARNASTMKYDSLNPLTFFSGMIMLYNPLAIPILLSGMWILFHHQVRYYCVIGIAIISVFVILMVNFHSKTEYFNPAAVLLLAAGSVQIEQWILLVRWKTVRTLYLTVLLAFGVAALPFAIDILPIHWFEKYSKMAGVTKPSTEGHQMGSLPQHFADRFGWKELADNVISVYDSLPENEKNKSMIYTQNYGEAGAIEFFGRNLHLPHVLSGHNNYWIWGKERFNDSIGVLIAVGGRKEDYYDTFEDVTLSGIHRSDYAMPYENNLPIYICRKPRFKIRDVWHSTKHYI